MNLRQLLAVLMLFSFAAIAQNKPAVPDTTEADWKAVLALEAGPRQADIRSRDEARAITLAHLAKQEASLRDFLRRHPASVYAVDAQLRLARLLAVRSDLNENAAEFNAALRLLEESKKTAPAGRLADIDFATMALSMRHIGNPTDQDCESLTRQMFSFQKSYPGDSRVPALMTEIAGLYDTDPRRKGELLNQALSLATVPELRARIEDDLKRLSLLDHPVSFQGTTLGGDAFDTANTCGKITVVVFFATWSAPSLLTLNEVEKMRKTFVSDPVIFLGVSLDSTREPLDALLKTRNISCPILFDGKGWKSPLIRSLCLNAIPTVWILDRKGNLRTLNARSNSEAIIRGLLKEN